MNERRLIKEIVYAKEHEEYSTPIPFDDYLNGMLKSVKNVPFKYKERLFVNIEHHSYYDSLSSEIEIYYARPENDEEYEVRLLREKQAKEWRENQELCQLEVLKAKYGV